jgi:flagellar motility protein MotE (MotC chaperone)
MRIHDRGSDDGSTERHHSGGGAGTGRKVPGRLVRIGLAVVFLCKLTLVALWYSGGLSAALALAADGSAGRSAPGKASEAMGAGETIGKNTLASARVPTAGTDASDGSVAPKAPEPGAMVEAITRRQSELDAREREIVAREAHLKIYEQDVTAKIASLEEIEKRLQVRAKAASAAIDAAAESLAKVYGAMKAGDAAPILERLDEPTVLTIFGRMKEKQIGEILPLMSKEKAITLTQALAASASR